MRSKCTTVAAAIGFLLLAGSGFGQESTIVTFTALESGATPGNPAANIPYRGMIKCVGLGDPTAADGISPPWCPDGTVTTARGRIFIMKWDSSDPNLSGTLRYYLDMNVDSASWIGDWWGYFMLDVPGKGTWEGWVFGESAGRGPTGSTANYRLLGVGSGTFQKSHMMAEVSYVPGKQTTVTGRYLYRTPTSATSKATPTGFEFATGLDTGSGLHAFLRIHP